MIGFTDKALVAWILGSSASRSKRRKPAKQSVRPRPAVLRRTRRRTRNLRSRRLSKRPKRRKRRKPTHGRKPRRPKPLPLLLQRRRAELLVTPAKPTHNLLSYCIHYTQYILVPAHLILYNTPKQEEAMD